MPWMTLSHAQPTTPPTASPNRSSGCGNGNIDQPAPAVTSEAVAGGQLSGSTNAVASSNAPSAGGAGLGPDVDVQPSTSQRPPTLTMSRVTVRHACRPGPAPG